MESKKINQLATELVPDLSDLTIIGDPTTGISKKITLSQMASLFTGTVEEYANLAAFPLVGVADTIYIAKDTNVIYRWDSTSYVVLSPNIIASLVFNDANGFDGTIALVGSVATLTITTALTTGSVGFIGASGALLQDNANFFWDDTNNRLGIGTNAPTTALDVFGSGIIGRINGTSTNNAYLGFASAGTNKWSIGNVQSDHRFRIFSEANTSELVSVLQTGEFGIGITNPTTKLHIDGGASALIANLDANVSVAKSISFRSDNSNRINLEVSGTESGSNEGANFFIRRYSDAGALIDTPLTITRSTGAITLATALSGTNATFSDTVAITLTASDSRIIGGNTTGRLLLGNSGTSTYGIIYGATHATFPNAIQFVNNNTASLTLAANGMFTYEGTGNGIPLRFQDISAAITGQTAGYIGISTSAFSGNNGDLVLYPRTSATSRILLMGGSVGINVIPAPWGSPAGNIMQLGNRASIFSYNNTTTDIGNNIYFNGSDYIYLQTAGASLYRQQSGTHAWFTIGSGTAGNSAGIIERMSISSNGKTTINGGTANSSDYAIDIKNSNTTMFFVRNDGYMYFGLEANSPYNIAQSGRTCILASNGSVGYLSSTRESKTNIESIKNIDFINQLNPVQFNYRIKNDEINEYTDEFYDNLTYGFIADEVEKVNKELIFYNSDGTTLAGVDYNSMIAILTKAIQEQQAQIEELKALIIK